MHLAIITAGGAGMYCGSCMHDNTWARALIAQGEQVTLLPTYTPIRVDEPNASLSRVFLGGLNVYLEGRYRWWRALPKWMTRWVDHPGIIRLATKFAVSSDAKQLGDLTLSLLAGTEGPHRDHIRELAQFLAEDVRPDAIILSNLLLAGIVPEIKRCTSAPVYCLLQGDDIFLNSLVPPYQEQVIQKLREAAPQFDGFLLHSRYYRDYMADLLLLPHDKCHVLPLSIDVANLRQSLVSDQGAADVNTSRPYSIGYFARICPEKGLHDLIAAFRLVLKEIPEARLLAGGYLGVRDREYFKSIQQQTRDLGDAFHYTGSPDHAGKLQFLQSIDVLSVPTIYQEPKGIYILEAWSQGVPVVQPAHGSFPELMESVPGGLLYRPGDVNEHAAALIRLGQEPAVRQQFAQSGAALVAEKHDQSVLAQHSISLLRRLASEAKAAALGGGGAPLAEAPE